MSDRERIVEGVRKRLWSRTWTPLPLVLLEHGKIGVTHLIRDVTPVCSGREKQRREGMATLVKLTVFYVRPFQNRRPSFRTESLRAMGLWTKPTNWP